jgi:phage tail-like protein
MPDRDPDALLRTSYFRVLIGERELGFAEVSRLTSETDLTAPPGARVHGFETIVLRRALTTATELYDWRRNIVAGKADLREVTIHQLEAPDGRIANSWRLTGAWPRRWSGPAFNAAESSVAYEELELAFDDVVWLKQRTTPQKRPSRSPTTTPGG